MNSHPFCDKLVALSVSENDDLLALGYSAEHLNTVCLRLARSLLREGASIAYGGVLGVGDFTPTLREAAKYELTMHPSTKPDAAIATPFVNYQPWPYYLDVTAEQEARDTNFCTYRFVSDRPVSEPPSNNLELDAPRSAHASSRMRRWMAHDSDARIVVGGKETNFAGLMPGIVEEALFHLEVPKPLYIVGGFGGAAKALADAVLRRQDVDTLPATLIETTRDGNFPFDELLDAYPEDVQESLEHDVSRDEAKQSYRRIQYEIDQIGKNGTQDGFRNGLDDDENRSLMKSEDSGEIVRLVIEGLRRVL